MDKNVEYRPLMDEASAYNHGLLDFVYGRVSLVWVLVAAGELKLNLAYCRGWMRGRRIKGY